MHLASTYTENSHKNWVFQGISLIVPRKRAQHGSGIHQMIDLIARKHGFDESTISTKYMDLLKSRERVGSSQRYGYLFEDEKKKMWIAEPHVQMYLDSISKSTASTGIKCYQLKGNPYRLTVSSYSDRFYLSDESLGSKKGSLLPLKASVFEIVL